jgi:hypothetical protein
MRVRYRICIFLRFFFGFLDTMKITAMSNPKPGIVSNYIRIDIKSVRRISYDGFILWVMV